MVGVEIRKLPEGHALAGQHGLFATKDFSRCDIIGEYTGIVVGSSASGPYVACLEEKPMDECLGLDAATAGNEARFINSYLNIEFGPNVGMRRVHVSGLPVVLIVCIEPIFAGDEILLDYGHAYNEAFFGDGVGSSSSDESSNEATAQDASQSEATSDSGLPR